VYRGGWQPFIMTGTAVSGSDAWFLGDGAYTLNNPPSGTTYWVGYIRRWSRGVQMELRLS
jgi:hypothetical protein